MYVSGCVLVMMIVNPLNPNFSLFSICCVLTAILVEGGAQVDKAGWYGQNALHVAAIRGDESIVNFLLSKGGKVNEKDNNGDTALHLARRFGKEECTALLLANGADKDLTNAAGQKPYDYDAAGITNLSYE